MSLVFGGGEGILGGGGAGQGSGFVVNDEGEIVTNAHVVTDAQAGGGGGDLNEADEVYVEFADRDQVPADVVGFDPFADVALLEIDPGGLDSSRSSSAAATRSRPSRARSGDRQPVRRGAPLRA